MIRCLDEEKLERLARRCACWWRACLWRRHLRGCLACRSRLERLPEDEQFLAEVRRAVAARPKPSPLSEARSRLSGRP